GSSGGTVLGRCEARLAEALIGRGGSGSSASAGLTKDLPLAYACGAVSKDVESAKGVGANAAPFSAVSETQTLALEATVDSSSSSSSSDVANEEATGRLARDEGGADPSLPSTRTPAPPVGRDVANIVEDDSIRPRSSCFPGGKVFGRWCRRGAVVGENVPGSASGGEGGTRTGRGDVNRSADVRGVVGSKGEGRASTSRSSSSRWGSSSGRMSWGWRGALSGSERSSVRSVGSARASAKDLMKLATNGNSTPSIKEAEKLALADWGGCQGPSGGAGAARDIWKEILPAGGGGSGGGMVGTG
ncbi:unnamed protein product, partial [Sphacelaria rigidula]